MTAFERSVFVAQHPDAAAVAFHHLISAFLRIVVRYDNGRGLLGTCKAFYGMVEAQGRGTLHCHLLLWLAGNPNPQLLRDRMDVDGEFKQSMFTWLEDTIKCELPGMTEPLVEHCLDSRRKPVRATEDEDPRLIQPPIIHTMDRLSFQHEFQSFVQKLAVECNWHEHNDTCYKHLRQGEQRGEHNCRMRIDGSTRPLTSLDEETKSILLRRLHPRINNFNDVILFLLQSNMDIKYIGSGPAAKALVYYISDYITKSDLKVHAALPALQAAIQRFNEQETQSTNVSLDSQDRSCLIKCVNSLMGRQEVSHQQIMSRLIGGGDYYSSHSFRTVKFHLFVAQLLRTLSDNVENQTQTIHTVCDEQEDTVVLNTSAGTLHYDDDVADYMFCPSSEPFASMTLWEYCEWT
ncbi:hypothetical protein EV363DRAFT_1187805, partial [Boletus edulis]